MRILAASQKDDFALESGQLRHGLLTYALVKDGIEAMKADNNRDGQITLDEWLGYGVGRVPVLHRAIRNHSLRELFSAEGDKGPVVVGSGDSLKSKHEFQQPSLFDFALKMRDVMLTAIKRTSTQITSNRSSLAVTIGDPGSRLHPMLQLDDPQEVWAVAFSPNGKYVLTGSNQGTIRLWEAETGREVRGFDGHTGVINSVAFSHDGKYMISASTDATARLWKVETGAEVRRFVGTSDEVLSAAISPDGQYVLIADGYARLFRVDTGKEERRLEAYNSVVTSVAFSPDGKHILMGSTDSDLGEIAAVELWDVKSGQQRLMLKGFSAAGPDSISVAFSPDGKYLLAGSNDGAARLWDSNTGHEIRRFQTGSVNSVAFSADGQHILIAGDSKSILCATGSEKPLYRFPPARAVAFSPNGKYWLVGTQLWAVSPSR
jgi:WD40 repeat protein